MNPTCVRATVQGRPSSRTSPRSKFGAEKPVQDTVTTCVTSPASRPAFWSATFAARAPRAGASRSYFAIRSAVDGPAVVVAAHGRKEGLARLARAAVRLEHHAVPLLHARQPVEGLELPLLFRRCASVLHGRRGGLVLGDGVGRHGGPDAVDMEGHHAVLSGDGWVRGEKRASTGAASPGFRRSNDMNIATSAGCLRLQARTRHRR